MRLRLRCSTQYKLGDLQWCMVHVPDHLHSVGDLADHISKLLELGSHRQGKGAEPPQLMLEGFLVPHDEEIQAVLRDDEVIDIEPSETSPEGMLSLAAQPAWLSPGASGNTVASKRPLDWSVDSKPDAKRPRGGKGSVPAPMALGWQSAGSEKPAIQGKAAPQAAEDSDDEDSSDNDADANRTKPSGNLKPVTKVDSEVAKDTARAIALATCSTGDAVSSSACGTTSQEAGSGLFVGGLPDSLGDNELQKHFEKYGQVTSATIVMNNKTGKSKCYGFVEFADPTTRAKALADGPKTLIAGKMAEVKPRVAKEGKGEKGKGKDGKTKDHKAKDGKGGAKSKGGKQEEEQGGKKGSGKGKSKVLDDSDDTEEDSSDEEVPKKVPAPNAKASATSSNKAPAQEEESLIGSEELEVQKQMAALGLPVSFTAGEMAGGDDSDEDDEDEEDDA